MGELHEFNARPVFDVDTKFMDKGACRGEPIEMFYPGSHRTSIAHRTAIRTAKGICSVCTVAKECLDYSAEYEPYGVWGGMTDDERNAYRINNNILLKNQTRGLMPDARARWRRAAKARKEL